MIVFLVKTRILNQRNMTAAQIGGHIFKWSG